jgi:hypothetical protein
MTRREYWAFAVRWISQSDDVELLLLRWDIPREVEQRRQLPVPMRIELYRIFAKRLEELARLESEPKCPALH